MNGIPVKITRDGALETVYLSTRRSGDVGVKMSGLKRLVREKRIAENKAMTRLGLLLAKVKSIPDDADQLVPALQELGDESELLQDRILAAHQEAQEAAQELIRLSLAECHGQDAEAILDCLSDGQVDRLVSILESGDCPADFFPSRVTPPSGSVTSPADGGPGASSLNAAIPTKTLTPAGSGSKTP